MFIQEIFKDRRRLSITDWIWTINLIGDKRDKYLEGEIILRYCCGHDTIITLFSIKGFYDQHIRLLSGNFYFS